MTSSVSTQTRFSPVESLRRFFGAVFSVRYAYQDALDRQRAAALVGMCVAVGVLGLVAGIVLQIIFAPPVETLLLPIIIVSVVCLGVYLLAQNGRLRLASIGFVVVLVVGIFIPSLPWGILNAGVLGFALPIVTASLLLGSGWALATTIICSVCIAVLAYSELARLGNATGDQIGILTTNAALGIAIALILYGIMVVLTSAVNRWAKNAQRRAQQLEAAAVISEAANTATTVGMLLNLTVERVRDVFGFYHAQVFLLDSERRPDNPRVSIARLEASTGRAGAALMARGHSLPVGSRSIVGQATYMGKPIVVNDVRTSPIWRPNELLPETQAEMALPLLVGETVIGALDIQSIKTEAFQPEDVSSLQIVANQLAAFIDKTRLTSELQARAAEHKTLLEQAQTSLRQIEELNRQLTREGWSDYLRLHRTHGALGYTLDGKSIQEESDWTAPMRQAYNGERSVVIRQDQHAHIAAVPLRVRGEVIGVLEFERDGSRPWTDADIELVETLVDRLGLAVENARLYEEATLAAEREHVVNKIAQDVQEAESIDAILQAALAELSSVLGASRGVVQISPKVGSE